MKFFVEGYQALYSNDHWIIASAEAQARYLESVVGVGGVVGHHIDM